jgi:hypothetical protein
MLQEAKAAQFKQAGRGTLPLLQEKEKEAFSRKRVADAQLIWKKAWAVCLAPHL